MISSKSDEKLTFRNFTT